MTDEEAQVQGWRYSPESPNRFAIWEREMSGARVTVIRQNLQERMGHRDGPTTDSGDTWVDRYWIVWNRIQTSIPLTEVEGWPMERILARAMWEIRL